MQERYICLSVRSMYCKFPLLRIHCCSSNCSFPSIYKVFDNGSPRVRLLLMSFAVDLISRPRQLSLPLLRSGQTWKPATMTSNHADSRLLILVHVTHLQHSPLHTACLWGPET